MALPYKFWLNLKTFKNNVQQNIKIDRIKTLNELHQVAKIAITKKRVIENQKFLHLRLASLKRQPSMYTFN